MNVPGHGKRRIDVAAAVGGPSLLVETVHDLTGVPINDFARFDFVHVAVLVDAFGGGLDQAAERDRELPVCVPGGREPDRWHQGAEKYPSSVTASTP